MPRTTGPSAYQLGKQEQGQKEYWCGIMHSSLEEAMVHAEQNLGFRDAQGNLIVQLEPLLGGTRFSNGTVIGWQAGCGWLWPLSPFSFLSDVGSGKVFSMPSTGMLMT